jgi:uncharacterized membrane protein
MKVGKPAQYLAMGALLALAVASAPVRNADAMSTGSGSGGDKTYCTMFTGTGPNDLIIIREEGETYTDKDGNTWKCTHWGDWLMVPMVSTQPGGRAPVSPLPLRSALGS